MKRRRFIFLGIGILLLTGISLLPTTRWRIKGWMNGEAFYRGRPTSYWYEQCRYKSWLQLQYEASRRSNWLIDWLPGSSDQLTGQALAEQFADPEAIPVLLELLRFSDATWFAAYALDRFDSLPEAAIPVLVSVCRGPVIAHPFGPCTLDQQLRGVLLRLLTKAGSSNERAVPYLHDALAIAENDELLQRTLLAILQDHP
jgi:hypothetical protein